MYKIRKIYSGLYKIFSITIDVNNINSIDLGWCMLFELDGGGFAGSSEIK